MRRGLATVGANVMTCKRDTREHGCVVGGVCWRKRNGIYSGTLWALFNDSLDVFRITLRKRFSWNLMEVFFGS